MSRRPSLLIAAVALAAFIGACSSDAPVATRSGLPARIAAAGDSMTRAFNVGSCCVYSDAPEYSWATGDNAAVDSHYRRLRELNPSVREFNFARTGAKIADLDRQLRGAAAQKVDYLTILIGANDLLAVLGRAEDGCKPNPTAMTSVPTFKTRFRTALARFVAARPKASILVASIPNVPRLWGLFSKDQAILDVWSDRGSCQAALADARTDVAIRAASTRLRAYNDALAQVCKGFATCRWDGGATYRFPFRKADFSAVDYFHPNATGQRRIAAITWRAGFWG
ncbi:MAG: GDSL-type esterase/lipase family protein [Actinomycetota bacterium]